MTAESGTYTFRLDNDQTHIWFSCPHMDIEALLPAGGGSGWTVEQKEPLTVRPSILNQPCGCHGFIIDGKWVQV